MLGDSLPTGWKWVTLEDVKYPDKRAIVSGPFGSNIGSRFFVSSGVPVIRGNNLTADMTRYIDDGYVFLTEEKAQEFRNCEACANDLIFTAAGTLGQVGIIPPNAKYPRYIISNKQMRARVNENVIFPLYAYYWLASSEIVEYITQRNTGSSVPLINLSVLRELPIPLAPIPEQKAIVRVLSALDDKIELNRRMNHTLEAMARALFKSWFVDFDPVLAKSEGRLPFGMSAETAALFPAEFVDSELGAIPKGWWVSTIGDIAHVIDCLHTKKPERQENGQILLQLNNIRDDGLVDLSDNFYISDADYQNWISHIEASEGDCVITNVGRVGSVAQIPPGFHAALGRNMTAIRCKDNYRFPAFLITCLMSEAMREEIKLKTDTGTILDALNKKNIPLLRFVFAPNPVLFAFENVVRPLHAQMETNLATSRMLSNIRDALLPRLLSGEVRVKAKR